MSEGSSKKISKSDWKGKLRELKERQKELKDKPRGKHDGHKRVNFLCKSQTEKQSVIQLILFSFIHSFIRLSIYLFIYIYLAIYSLFL